MLKIVLDTNVLVSGLLKPNSPPEIVLSHIFDEQIQVYFSKDILDEYRGVLVRDKFRKKLNHSKVMSFLDQLQTHGCLISPDVRLQVIKDDPADNKFLECSVEAPADFFVTGNKKHFSFTRFRGTRIVTPKEFIQILAERIFE